MTQCERLSGAALLRQPALLAECRKLAALDPVFNIIILADLHLPQIADTDFVLAREDGQLVCIGLAYRGYSPPSIGVSAGPGSVRRAVLDELHENLPVCMAWSDAGDEDFLTAGRQLSHRHDEYQMVFEGGSLPAPPEWVQPVRAEQAEEMDAFYHENVAEAWLPAHLAAGPYFCVRQNGQIVSAGGVHFANPYIAQVGNMVTVPKYRRQGYGTGILMAIVGGLREGSRIISLGVVQDNEVAIRLYRRFGFRVVRDIKVLETKAS